MSGGESYWISSTEPAGYPRLENDLRVSVAVVGGGIAGLTTALLLEEAGVDVAVLEAAEVGTGVTGHTTGKVTAGQGLAYSLLEERHGAEAARAYATSQSAGVELVARLADSLGVECDLERAANYVFAEREEQIELLVEEAEAARRAGLPVELEHDLELPFPAVAALRLEEQLQLHARKYVLGLARAIAGGGHSRIFERTRVLGVEPGAHTRLETESGTVTVEQVVLATNAPITSEGLLFAKALPWRAYAVAAPLAEPPLAGMWINAGPPTRSLRTAPLADGRTLLIVVGEGHRVGQDETSPHYEALASYLRVHFPGADARYAWSTQDQYSVDGLPYIGRVGDDEARLYVATGFGGWGLSNGSLAGVLLSDAILGRANEWSALYDPTRSTLRRAPGALVKENANVARQLVGGKLRRRPASLSEVPERTGRIVDLDGTKAAVYRDDEGTVYAVSPSCTHMGCDVTWNDAERSWDCPCHGSRFAPDGAVLEGPATRPLAAVDVEVRTAVETS